MNAPRLTTARLRMRLWRPDDLTPLCALLRDPDVVRYLGGHPLDDAECRDVYDRRVRQFEQWGYGIWALERADEPGLIGWAGLAKAFWLPGYEDEVEAAWMLDPVQWGQGYASEAGAAAVGFGIERLGLPSILGIRHPDNHRSQRVMRTLGFTDFGESISPKDGAPLVLARLDAGAWAPPAGEGAYFTVE
jgi:RimJ/RimL family protein N-acetyltransferase